MNLSLEELIKMNLIFVLRQVTARNVEIAKSPKIGNAGMLLTYISHVFARKLTWYLIDVQIIRTSISRPRAFDI